MSQVFTPELVYEFVSKLTAPPPDVKIMTRDEFFYWWMPNEWTPFHATRGVTEGSKFFNATYKQQLFNHLQEVATDFGTNHISDVCVSGSITPDYVAGTFGYLLMEDPEYDALFAVHNSKICKYFTLNIYKKCDSMIHNVDCLVFIQYGILRDVSYEFFFLGVFFGIGRAAYNISH